MTTFRLYGEVFKFEAEKPLVHPVTKEYLKDDEGNIKTEIVNYEIREISAAVRDAFLNENAKRMRYNREGKVIGVREHKGMYSGLLAICLYDENGKLIPEKEIQSWPTTTQEALFIEANKINKLNKEAPGEAELGND